MNARLFREPAPGMLNVATLLAERSACELRLCR
jgi:hypothetical protein